MYIARSLLVVIMALVFGVSHAWAEVTPPDIAPQLPLEPQLKLSTNMIDFGVLEPGREASHQIEVTNRGSGVLKWKVVATRKGEPLPYVMSLVNDEIRGSGRYQPPAAHRDCLEITGVWKESQGWPVMPPRGVLRYHFYGTGIAVYYWKAPNGGKFSFYCDQQWLGEVGTAGEKLERAWVDCVAHLPVGRHTLSLVAENGNVILDGFEVTGREVQWAPKQAVRFLPDCGDTTKEIDYVTVTVNPNNLLSGVYGYSLTFLSNGGEEAVSLTWEVRNEGTVRLLDVFRFLSPQGTYFFTTDPQADDGIIKRGQYQKEGVAFRLFPRGTPGTVELYRWYNPNRDSFFYSANKTEVERLERGYVLEGTVGNIATTKLRNTRELYRWYHPKKDYFLYGGDQRARIAEGIPFRWNRRICALLRTPLSFLFLLGQSSTQGIFCSFHHKDRLYSRNSSAELGKFYRITQGFQIQNYGFSTHIVFPVL